VSVRLRIRRRVARSEELDDGGAAVVGDDVHLIELEPVAERRQHGRLRVEREVLIGARARHAMRHQVDGDAAADVRDPIDDGAPQVAVQEDPVDEEGGGACAALGVRDVSEGRRGVQSVREVRSEMMLHAILHAVESAGRRW